MSSISTGRAARTPRWVAALWGVAGLLLAVFLVWTLPGVRPQPGFDVAFDGVLQGSGYALLAVLAVLGATLRVSRSLPWWLVAAAVVLRAVGFVLSLTALSLKHPLPYPSVADVAWVLSSLALIAAVSLRLHETAPRLSRLVVLDGVAGALVVLGVACTVLLDPVVTLTEGVTRQAVFVNVGYPVLDTALLVAAAALVTSVRLQLRRADVQLVSGIVAFAAVDVAYLVLLAQGAWRPGTMLASLSLVATGVIASAVGAAPADRRTPRRRVGEPPRPEPAPGIAMPATLGALGVSGLVVVGVLDVPALALAPYAVAMGVVIVRGILTLRGDRAATGEMLGLAGEELRSFHALVEASKDFIGMADAEGNVLYLNPTARRMLGLSREEDVTRRTVAEILPGRGDRVFRQRWDALLRAGSWEGESAIGRLDGTGEVIPVAASTFVVYESDSGRPFVIGTIQRDIRDLARAEAAMRDLARQRERLLGRLVQAQEDERTRIAGDVHDDSVQVLAAVDLRLGLLRRRLEQEAPHLLDVVDGLHDTVAEATERLRHLLFDLESPARRSRLAEALTEAAEFVFEGTDVRWRVSGDPDVDLPEAGRVTAYRIAKEALVNVGKHAHASTVEIELCADDEGVTVLIRDDGRGVQPDDLVEQPGHLGLASMRDRAEVAGGQLEVRRLASGGTEVRFRLPLPGPAPEGPDDEEASPA